MTQNSRDQIDVDAFIAGHMPRVIKSAAARTMKTRIRGPLPAPMGAIVTADGTRIPTLLPGLKRFQVWDEARSFWHTVDCASYKTLASCIEHEYWGVAWP